MALTNINPAPQVGLGRLPFATHATITLNNATASNNVFAAIVVLQPNQMISAVRIVGGGAPAGTPTYNVSVEGVTNSGAGYGGRPNGTPLTSTGGGSVPMVSEDNDGTLLTSGTVVTHEFVDSYTNPGPGPQLIALTIRTGTSGSGLNATNTITIKAGYQTWLTNFTLPHYSTLTSGSWAHTGNCPTVWAVDQTGKVTVNASNSPTYTNETNWNSASSPNRRGLRWDAQFGCRVSAFWVAWRPAANSNPEFVINVYESDGTTLKTTGTATYNFYSAISSNPGIILTQIPIPPQEVEAGDVVRIFLKPDATANAILQFANIEWSDSSSRNAFFGTSSSVFQYTSSSDGSTWTDVDTKFPLLIPVIDQIETGGGGTTTVVRRTQKMMPDGRIASFRG